MLVPDSFALEEGIGVGAGELWGESRFLSARRFDPGIMNDCMYLESLEKIDW